MVCRKLDISEFEFKNAIDLCRDFLSPQEIIRLYR
ncbi:hypothetical protein [Campylobacter phage CP21]|uniref:Uncharacterized protein n=1 Tax=Campylobacter phage CP21 TaxID=2881391 RepID=I7II89_9CAUD|nr:hypothetical protein F421_gp170 [Campylobacter phage CP21]CCH63632.1 hypothetical protein [Campylobacter phage CP21]